MGVRGAKGQNGGLVSARVPLGSVLVRGSGLAQERAQGLAQERAQGQELA
jgi:hypothetical protein